MAVKTRNMMEIHQMLAHPSEEKMRKMTQAMGIPTTDQWGPCEAYLQAKEKRHAVPKMKTRSIMER